MARASGHHRFKGGAAHEPADEEHAEVGTQHLHAQRGFQAAEARHVRVKDDQGVAVGILLEDLEGLLPVHSDVDFVPVLL